MRRFSKFSLIIFIFSSGAVAKPLEMEKINGKIVTECGVTSAKQHVWIFKQWHLAPNVNTQKNPTHPPAQEQNQTAIYRQLANWITQKKIKTIFSEGCAGEINDSFKKEFNGWSLKDLRALADDPSFSKIVTLVPLKLKAKFDKDIDVYGGDSDELLKRENLALSDARGTLGFLTQITANQKDAAKVRPYLTRAISLDHLASDATPEQVIKVLHSDLQEDVKKVMNGIEERNLKFVDVVKSHPSKESALVIGGLHASGLIDLFKKNNIDCSVVEPVGYDAKDEKVIEDLKKL